MEELKQRFDYAKFIVEFGSTADLLILSEVLEAELKARGY